MFLVLLCIITSIIPVRGTSRIRTLLIGGITSGTYLGTLFKEEPLVELVLVPCRDGLVPGDRDVQLKYIKQYFPRTYGEMQSYDYIMLVTAAYDLLTAKQDKWIYDRIAEGAGGLNDQSVLSASHTQIHTAWANSMAQRAFPNDAPAVVARDQGIDYTKSPYYGVLIVRDFPDPVLTPYLPYGVERHLGYVGRFVIPRQSAGIMAYQTGNFHAQDRVPFLIAWDYKEGRALTCGGALHERQAWFGRHNPYGADMLINIILYATQRDLIRDVEVFHRIKGNFREFRDRMELLGSLIDFIENFGANTREVNAQIIELREMRREAAEKYLDQDFRGSEDVMHQAFDKFQEAEAIAKDTKNSALLWVYIIEWLATTSVLFISGFILWTVMVRRRLYRTVSTTRMA